MASGTYRIHVQLEAAKKGVLYWFWYTWIVYFKYLEAIVCSFIYNDIRVLVHSYDDIIFLGQGSLAVMLKYCERTYAIEEENLVNLETHV